MLLFERICFPVHTALLRLAKSFLSKTEEWRKSCRSMNEVSPPSPACSPDTVLAGPGIYFSACCNKCSSEYFWKTDFLYKEFFKFFNFKYKDSSSSISNNSYIPEYLC